MGSSIVALLSDLGTKDYFVGAMKGVILSINPDAKIIDISHEVRRHDVLSGALLLSAVAEAFPKGTIFVAVVDPGVGTERKIILLETANGLRFIGPDNGIFALVAERFGVARVREVTNRRLMRDEISSTFHGRDIMAPVAAHLSLGLDPAEVGPELEGMKLLEVSKPRAIGARLLGRVLNIDQFGNLVTNIGADLASRFAKVGEELEVEIGGNMLKVKFARTYGEVKPGECLCYVGSSGALELGKNMGDLASELGVKIGSELVVRKVLR